MISENESSRSAESARRERVGKSALLRRQLEEDVARAFSEGGDDLKGEIAQKRLELFEKQHDPSGAWKRDRLGRDLGMEFQKRNWERDAEGRFTVTAEDERSHLVLINMGELDRLNASGDHSLGDAGLRMTAERIEEAAREILSALPEFKDERRLSDAYDVYRFSGNDFALALRGVDALHAQEILTRIAKEPLDISEIRPDEESIPLAGSRISRAEGLALMNAVDERPEDAGLSNERVLMQAMFEKLQTLNDIAKLESRTERGVEKLLQVERGEIGEAAARDFYEKFLRKSLDSAFRPVFAEDAQGFDAFKRLVYAKRESLTLPPPPEWTHLVTERVLEGAFDELRSRRALGRSVDIAIARNVASRVLGKSETFGQVILGEEHVPSSPDFQPPEETRGHRLLDDLRKKAEDAARGDDLLEAENVALDFEIAKASRDERTGLFQREIYFQTMEDALREGRCITNISIDMAFLKYFDKEGGRAAGDIAIAKAAEVLDRVAANLSTDNVQIEAYRTGGDEFALTIVGGGSEMPDRVLRELRKLERSAGRIPAQPGAKEAYRAEALQFNVGLRTAEDAASFRSELEAAGIPLKKTGTPQEQNELAEYLMRLADKEVEIQKGVNRLLLLMLRSLEARETGEKKNLETLKAYSQKAIFGEAGMRKINEWTSRLAESQSKEVELGSIRGEVLSFVIDQLDKKRVQAETFEAKLEHHLEDAVRVRYFDHRIRELEEHIASLEMLLSHKRSADAHLAAQQQAAESEHRAIVELREKLKNR